MEELESIEIENAAEEVLGADELPPSSELTDAEVGEILPADHELSDFASAEIEEIEFVEIEKLHSIVESILFASDRPVTVEAIKSVFKGTNIKSKDIRRTLEELSVAYAGADRGVSLDEVGGGYQLRTKVDNAEFMKRHVKGRAFRLSGPALEVLSIVAYKQPVIKSEVDQIRGVESGHLMRALMDRSLIRFGEKSELPGKPMFYETTRKFLEIFGLRNIKELPSLSEIDQLIPEGIGEVEESKPKLMDITGDLTVQTAQSTYSDGEDELLKISEQLSTIDTSTDFFEQEKARQKRKRDEERAQDIREAMVLGQEVDSKDSRWLKKYESMLEEEKAATQVAVQEISAQPADLVLDARDEVELTDSEILEKVEFQMQEEGFSEATESPEHAYETASENSFESEDSELNPDDLGSEDTDILT